MEDELIIELYWQRSEQAISETATKYERYCGSIASAILLYRSDIEECLNDTWFSAWNLMPPNWPSILSAFLGKITRSLSIDIIRKSSALKRGGGETTLALDELDECIPSHSNVEAQVEDAELSDKINRFLETLPEIKRNILVCRYWYLDSIIDISKRFAMSESKVKSILHRTRQELRSFLEEVYS